MPDLIVNDVAPRVQYTANGATSVFTFPFPAIDATDLKVWFGDGDPASSYTVSGLGQTAGGQIQFAAAPPSGTRVTILRDMPVRRLTDFQDAGEFRASAINEELDRLAMMVQQVEHKVDRAAALAPTATPASVELPAPVADGYIRWNSGATVLVADQAVPAAVATSAANAASAAASATAASSSQTAASTSASAAATSAAAAATSATNAATSATSAATSATAASNSATNAATHAATASAGSQFVVAGGSADAMTATPGTAWASYANGAELRVRALGPNTVTTPTLNVSGLGTKTLVKHGGSALAAGDYAADQELTVRYNSTSDKIEIINPKASTPTYTGDVSSSGSTLTIGTNVVTNAKAAQMAASTLKGNNTGSTANAADLTVAQVQSLLGIAPIDYCVVVMSADQTGIADAVTTKINFDQTQDGHNSAYVDATNKRFKPTVASTWIVMPFIALELYSPNNGYQYAWLTKNGTKLTAGHVSHAYNVGGWIMDTMPVAPCAISFNGSTDYADMWVNCDTNGTASSYNKVASTYWLCNEESTQMLCIRVA